MKKTSEIIRVEIANDVFQLEPIPRDMNMLIAEVSQVFRKE